jgi:hypothetical protein
MAVRTKRRYRINCDKINRMLPSFRPQRIARRGAQELYEAYRAAGFAREDAESGRYVRMSLIQCLLKAGRLDDSLRFSQRHVEAAELA